MKVKVVKNKVAPPFKACQIDIIYGKGISKEGEILDLAVEHNFVNKTGNWYEYNGEKIGNGREAGKSWLKEHPDISQELENKIRAIFKEDAK